MFRRLLFLAIAILSLVACSKGGTGGSADSGSLSPTSPAASATTPSSASNSTGQQAASLSTSSTSSDGGGNSALCAANTMQVDLDRRLICLPSTGWLNEDQFWDIYYNEPQKLPGTIDFSALNKLGYRDKSADANSGAGT